MIWFCKQNKRLHINHNKLHMWLWKRAVSVSVSCLYLLEIMLRKFSAHNKSCWELSRPKSSFAEKVLSMKFALCWELSSQNQVFFASCWELSSQEAKSWLVLRTFSAQLKFCRESSQQDLLCAENFLVKKHIMCICLSTNKHGWYMTRKFSAHYKSCWELSRQNLSCAEKVLSTNQIFASWLESSQHNSAWSLQLCWELFRQNLILAEKVLSKTCYVPRTFSALFQTDTDQIQIQPVLRHSCISSLIAMKVLSTLQVLLRTF